MTDSKLASSETRSHEEVRLEKIHALKEKNISPYAQNFNKKDAINDIVNKYKTLTPEDTCQDTVQTAGRLLAKRGHGKACFANISDEKGSIQLYANVSVLGKGLFEQLVSYDIGDIIGIIGTPFITKRGELSIKLSSVKLLTKSLLPLPEKYHGLQDKELRYRKRYLDLIANPDIKKVFQMRSETISYIRNFLTSQSFIEVETPVLHNIYGGAAAKPFETHHNVLDQRLYLRIALELHLKRLIVGGFERIFEIGRVFRNEGVSYKHNPEYTLLELYQAYADYKDVMALTEALLSSLVHSKNQSYDLPYQGKIINFAPPFQVLSLEEAIKKYADVDINNLDALRQKAKENGLELGHNASKGELINTIYDKYVESHLIQPTFIIDYPWETSPLAKRKANNPDFVERFELIINGMEIANAFSELNDPIDQKLRFEEQLKAKEAGYEEAHEMDDDFIESLKYGMPPTGGLGIGIDRVVMLLTDSHSIRDVLFFPHMKTLS